MLVNFSNHPFSSWPLTQQQDAYAHYGEVRDVSFPHIEPEWSDEEILELGMHYSEKICALRPDAVYVVGEHIFTTIMVHVLQEKNVLCLGTKSKRLVQTQADGTILKRYVYEGLRAYPCLTAN